MVVAAAAVVEIGGGVVEAAVAIDVGVVGSDGVVEVGDEFLGQSDAAKAGCLSFGAEAVDERVCGG